MATCPQCKSSLYVHKCMACLHAETPPVEKDVLPCEWPCIATIHVQETLTGKPVMGIHTTLDGALDDTDANGFRVVKSLPPGTHTAAVSLADNLDKYAFPIGSSDAPVPKTIQAGENEFYSFTLDPLRPLKVVVKRRDNSKGVKDAKVTIAAGKAGNEIATKVQTTPVGGDVTFPRLRQDTYKLQLELDATAKGRLEPELLTDHHVMDMALNPNEHVFWVRLVIHLKLKYKDPDQTVRHFPKDFPVTVAFDDGTSKDLQVLDDEGYFKFEVEDAAKKTFTLKFDSTKARYLVHPSRAVPDPNAPSGRKDVPKTKVFEDPSDDDLLAWTTDDKKFFALPKTWALIHSDWTQTDVVVKADGQIDIGDGVGAADKPAELSLEPKFQYVRFEFHDRKYGGLDEPHAGARVSIPPIVLKGSRESTDAGAPINPISGTHDTISNWQINPGDGATACQVLPWIKLKDNAGTALPKFNNKLLLEFGWKNAFVESTGKTAGDRKIIVLEDADPRRKPNKHRPQFYDLPEVWKSKWYYTRLSDENKNKFFDKFLAANDPDLEASLAEGGKLSFSLDDIVLVDAAGNQETIQDKRGNPAQTSIPLSKYSRLTILELDRKDKKFKVKVHDPFDDAKYWSKGGFAAESVNGPWRNVIAKYPVNPRVVVFCSQFHDIYDKRTLPADCAGKKIMGARAAKVEDTDISSQKVLMDQAAHATNGYVGYKGTFTPRWHYLHYGEVDESTVYGALVVYWSASFERSNEADVIASNGAHIAQNGSHADVDLFRDKGMELAMKRWNDKDYYFEENDDKTDLRIKTFALFETKGVKISNGVFSDTGGARICQVLVRNNEGGSWATVDGSQMMMRNSGAKDEGQSWGSDPGTLPVIAKFEGGNANAKCAFAHELGHSAFALYDSYLTSYGKLCITGDRNQKISNALCCYENMYTDKQDGQEYLACPTRWTAAP